jgi:hypothetical protein
MSIELKLFITWSAVFLLIALLGISESFKSKKGLAGYLAYWWSTIGLIVAIFMVWL